MSQHDVQMISDYNHVANAFVRVALVTTSALARGGAGQGCFGKHLL
jgi:hypothetical protein